MDFGRVPAAQLYSIDFTLPRQTYLQRQVLPNAPAIHPQIHIGTTTWNHADWVGKLFPGNTKEKDLLRNYTQHFNCVELNATHYKIYHHSTIEKWIQQVNAPSFVFCPKMYQGISHFGHLSNKQALTQQFLQSIYALGQYLGPVFIQFSEHFAPTRQAELFAFLQQLPKHLVFFVEFRHPQWYAVPAITEQLAHFLYSEQIGWVITDTAGKRNCVHTQLTVPKSFVRFVANDGHATDFVRLQAWAQQLHEWMQQGLQDAYFFIHTQQLSCIPELAHYLATQLQQFGYKGVLQPQLPPSQSAVQQISLF